jgi:hypothetical protein
MLQTKQQDEELRGKSEIGQAKHGEKHAKTQLFGRDA